ncbi:hypothetical protein YPPY54_0064, partial [Yersinia pestis PY-54]
MVQGAVRPENS